MTTVLEDRTICESQKACAEAFSYAESRAHGTSFYERTPTSTEHTHPNGNVVFLTPGNRVGLRPRDTREEPLDDNCA